MKGYTKIEFLFAVFIFSLMLIYSGAYIGTSLTSIFSDIKSELAKTKAEVLIDILVNEPGIPSNWELNPLGARRIGLAIQPYNLSIQKIKALQSNCEIFSKKFDVLGYRLLILNLTDNSIILRCGNVGHLKSYAERSVVIGKDRGRVMLEIWW
jgi:Flp pilus assembly pilin Flp